MYKVKTAKNNIRMVFSTHYNLSLRNKQAGTPAYFPRKAVLVKEAIFQLTKKCAEGIRTKTPR